MVITVLSKRVEEGREGKGDPYVSENPSEY